MILWSVDPGAVHVAAARWHASPDGFVLYDAYEFTPGEFRDQLVREVEGNEPVTVVVEEFSLAGTWSDRRGRDAVLTIELIGQIEAICWLNGTRFLRQQPAVRHVAQASPYWKDVYYGQDNETLRIARGNPHVRSAIAHGLYATRFGALKGDQHALVGLAPGRRGVAGGVGVHTGDGEDGDAG